MTQILLPQLVKKIKQTLLRRPTFLILLKKCCKETGVEPEYQRAERTLNPGEFFTQNEVLKMQTICELRKVDPTKPTYICHVGLKNVTIDQL